MICILNLLTGASILALAKSIYQFYYLKECILFEERLCFKPKYIHYVYSFVAYVAFRLLFALRVGLLFFFSHVESRCHGK